jgi:putative ABC transport system permease protein
MMRHLALTVAVLFVRAVSAFTPRAVRGRWTEEWLAELDHASHALRSRRFAALRLWAMACGAALDALLLRRLPRSPMRASRPPRRLLPGFAHDVRYALRGLAASPGFAVGVIGGLGLALAANTVAFSFINAGVFRPFPGVTDQDRLVRLAIGRSCGRPGCDITTSSYDDYVAMREGLPGLKGLAARTNAPIAVMIRGEARSLHGAYVSANYFDVLGVVPGLGRGFRPDEAALPGSFVAVISHGLWIREFKGHPSVLGQTIEVSGGSARVVGVAPKHFSGSAKGEIDASRDGRGTEIWLPLSLAGVVSKPDTTVPRTDVLPEPERYYSYFGRLHDGIDAAGIRAQAEVLAAGIAAARPATRQGAWLRVTGVWLNDPARMAPAIALFLAVPLIVLGIACVNAANLLLARATRRDREIAVRLALGATRWRVVRQLLIESSILAVASAGAALLLSYYIGGLVFRHLPFPMAIDYRVLAYTLAVAMTSAIGFGLAPALRVTGGTPQSGLTGSQPAGGAPRHSRTRRALVVAQVAMSLSLLATGAQFVSSVGSMGGTAGTDPDRLLMASFDLDQLKYSPAAAQEFYRQLLDRLAAVPQADGAGLARATAFWTFGRGMSSALVVWRQEDGPLNGTWYLGGYAGGAVFDAVGFRVLQGRTFTADDRGGAPRVAIVNRPFAERLFGGAAVDRIVRVGVRGAPYEASTEVRIVGVVEPAFEPSYSPQPVPALYVPAPLQPEPALTLYVRSRGPLETLVPAVRSTVRDIDPRVPFTELASLRQLNDRRLQEDVWSANGVMMLGGLALVLATAGLYGVVSYVVAMRSREIGVRMALGADPQAMLAMVVRQAMSLAFTGAAIGGGAALAIGRIVRSQMQDVRGLDMTAFLGSAAILLLAMVIASAVPARRASRIDPIIVLRQE